MGVHMHCRTIGPYTTSAKNWREPAHLVRLATKMQFEKLSWARSFLACPVLRCVVLTSTHFYSYGNIQRWALDIGTPRPHTKQHLTRICPRFETVRCQMWKPTTTLWPASTKVLKAWDPFESSYCFTCRLGHIHRHSLMWLLCGGFWGPDLTLGGFWGPDFSLGGFWGPDFSLGGVSRGFYRWGSTAPWTSPPRTSCRSWSGRKTLKCPGGWISLALQ